MPFTQSLLKGDRKCYVILIQKDAAFPKNSPWNIAADFDVDMSFSAEQIAAMLWEYETDHHTGMDVEAVAEYLYQYTSGYPYLVSALCKIIDEKLPLQEAFADEHNIWTMEGIEAAVRIILRMKAALYDSMIKHITEYPDLKEMLYAMQFKGEQIVYSQDNHTIELACMFGYIQDDGISVKVANRIFETRLYNLFLSEEELSNAICREAKENKSQFVYDGRLNMERILEKFVEHFNDIYGENNNKFVEDYGHKFFLLYLRQIIMSSLRYRIKGILIV